MEHYYSDISTSQFIEMFGDPVTNPKGLPMKTIKDVCKISGGSQPPRTEFVFEPKEGYVRFIQIRDYKSDDHITYIKESSTKKFCEADDIMIGRYGPPIFQILKGIKGAYNVALMKAEPIKVNKEFLRFYLSRDQLREHLEQFQSRSAGQAGIEMSELYSYPFPDISMELQQQFVAIVEQADKSGFDGIKSQFIEMFQFKTNPENWPVLKFTDFASIDATMTTDFGKYADAPHIGIDSIEQNTGRLLGYRTVKEDNVKSGKYIFTSNHIIYSKIRPNLNKVATPDFDGLCSADSYPILPIKAKMSKEFLTYLMRSDYFLEYIIPLSNRTGMPKVNREQVEGFTIPLPPMELQEQFVAIAEQADKSGYYYMN